MYDLSDYACVGISAIDTALSTNRLRGRPFRGVSILVHDVYSERINIHKCAERFVVLSIDKFIFVNVYLPYYRNQDDVTVVTELIEELSAIIGHLQND